MALQTRALLACGAVGGPMYVTVTMIQALTRDGFDLRQHRFSWLTAGDLGWIQQANMLIARWFAAQGQRRWAWCYGAGIPAVFLVLTVAGAIAFLATPWIWMTALAIHLYLREER